MKCNSEGQMLVAAEPDLYLLQGEQPYALNFLKGAFGLWCQLCIVIGLAVACSTYLSGVLSLLATAFIFVVGFFTDHLSELAQNRAVGGGPLRSMAQRRWPRPISSSCTRRKARRSLRATTIGHAWKRSPRSMRRSSRR